MIGFAQTGREVRFRYLIQQRERGPGPAGFQFKPGGQYPVVQVLGSIFAPRPGRFQQGPCLLEQTRRHIGPGRLQPPGRRARFILLGQAQVGRGRPGIVAGLHPVAGILLLPGADFPDGLAPRRAGREQGQQRYKDDQARHELIV